MIFLTVSGTKIINSLIDGEENWDVLSKFCHGKAQSFQKRYQRALTGKITDHHRFMLKLIREGMQSMDKFIEQVDQRIEEKSTFCKQQIEMLMSIPGVSKLTAEGIIAEIGTDMSAFPNEHHLASWGGVSPGNNESAGKKKAPEQ